MELVRDLATVTIRDIARVGGKAASLGEMIQTLTRRGIPIPLGFVITTDAYQAVIREGVGNDRIAQLIAQITDYSDLELVHKVGNALRTAIQQAVLPAQLIEEICRAYRHLSHMYHVEQIAVAVRSSATAEDLPTASYAGQQDTFLNVRSQESLLVAYQKAIASLFTDRALVYRFEQGIAHDTVALAVCVQKMVNTNQGAAGVLFTLDPESGFADVCSISATYGLGELLVQGSITPDEYVIYKKKLGSVLYPLIRTSVGSKERALWCTDTGSVTTVEVPRESQLQRVLSDDEIRSLTDMALTIESYYSEQAGKWTPMDIEWAKDGVDGRIYIVQARPETVHASRKRLAHNEYSSYKLDVPASERKIIVQGQGIGQKIVHGVARIIARHEDAYHIQPGDIIVTRMTDPDWVPALRKAAAIVTDLGGRTCHAAIVSRELGIPALVGTEQATTLLQEGEQITIDCSQGLQGYVYAGHIPYQTVSIALTAQTQALKAKLLLNIAQPESAFAAATLPVEGVGLARLEFIMSQYVGVHPMAIVEPERIADQKVRKELEERVQPYGTARDYFIMRLAEGIGMIAAAFYPRSVVVRLSDFKSNEYKNLLGGSWFEPQEENPMIGWRGASRYVTLAYQPAFALECAALQRVRTQWGFSNVHIMVPFVRSLEEMSKVGTLLIENGLARGSAGLLWYMMVELPVNVILLEHFAKLCDAFSIGSNDLTQLTLGVDRDSGRLHAAFDERSEAVKILIRDAIAKAHAAGKYISICGEAPSTYPEFATFLLNEGIDALSLSPDAVLPFLARNR